MLCLTAKAQRTQKQGTLKQAGNILNTWIFRRKIKTSYRLSGKKIAGKTVGREGIIVVTGFASELDPLMYYKGEFFSKPGFDSLSLTVRLIQFVRSTLPQTHPISLLPAF